MLEKMFTTKMSADKEKLQTRFSKIRSKNDKISKLISVTVFAIILVSIICVSVWVAVNKLDDAILYKNEKMNIQFEIPNSWYDKYIVDETNADDGCISVKHKRISQKYDGMGIFFSIMRIGDSEIDELVNMVGNMTVMWRNSEYGYVLSRPTDVQVPVFADNDEEDVLLSEDYAGMYRDVSQIESTFSLINEVEEYEIPNAENLSYAQISDLQRQVDTGHFPWRLEYEQVMQMYLYGIGENVEDGKLTCFAGDGEGCKGTYTVGDRRFTLDLFKPIDKTEHGIWVVRSCEEISMQTLKEVFFYNVNPNEAMIERQEDGWYRAPEIITASFPWFDVEDDRYPISVTAWYTYAGTEMDKYKMEIGRIKPPYMYRTMAQVLSMKLEFPKDATMGHLWFVFDYADGSSEVSEVYNIMMSL